MTAPVVLGIDLATSAARVVAVDADSGAQLGFLGAPLHNRDAASGTAARQRPDYPTVVRRLLSDTVAALGPRAADIAALSVTGTSGTVVPLGADGAPVGDAVLYNDMSAGDFAARLDAAGYPAGPGSVAARLAMLAQLPGVARLAFTPDVVLGDLAGGPVPSDTSHALKAGIDPQLRSWPAGLTESGLVPAGLLGPLMHPGRRVGSVADEVAAALALPAGVALVSGMTDGCCAQIAAGAVDVGDTMGVLGTTLVIKGVADARVESADGAVYSHYAPDGHWWPGGASNSGAGVLAGTVAQRELAALDTAAAELGPARSLRYPLPGVGERFPVADAAMTDWAVGTPTTAVEAHRSVLEGVAFVERLGLERLAALGVRLGEHRIVGGATRSSTWNRIRATVLGRPVRLVGAAGSGHGAAALAAATLLKVPLAELTRRWAGIPTIVHPDLDQIAALDASYRSWCEALQQHSALAAAH